MNLQAVVDDRDRLNGVAHSISRDDFTMTEAGLLPADWDVKPLGELIKRTEYGSSSKSKISGKCPVLRMGNIEGGYLDWTDLVFTDDPHEISKYSLCSGDVLFNRTNTAELVGKTALYRGERDSIFAGYLIRVVVDPRKLDARYLNYILNTAHARRYGQKVMSIAVGQANINAAKLRSYPIPLPPTVDEQSEIADALSECDDLIDSLETLLVKKNNLKHAVAQGLLSGKKRLPGFSGKWKPKRLAQIGRPYGGLTGKTKADFGNGNAKYIPFMNVMSNVVIDPLFLDSVVVKPAEQQNAVQQGDLFFNGSSETPEEVGMCSYLAEDVGTVFVNSFCFGFRLHDNVRDSGLFLAYLLRSQCGRDLLRSLAQGATRYNLSKKALIEVELELPTPQEQVAIASTLSDMDEELAAIQTKMKKARQIKAGMMQELLTGKKRLV